jgi:methylated-DNA-[protein]-cysteine S-methyltransferase
LPNILILKTSAAYYSSPIGTILINSKGNAIEEVLFINTLKGLKINDDEIDFDTEHSIVIKNCIRQLDEYFAGKRKNFVLSVAQCGTEFQKRVWNELLQIPYGKTISYHELSKRIGNVKAIRAVGTCNGSNKICIIVPCHRVIGSNGDLTGYGGDLWRKKWLLQHEAKYQYGVLELF